MDNNIVYQVIAREADKLFYKLGYSGIFPNYIRSIPGKYIAVSYNILRDDDVYRLSIRYVVADRKLVHTESFNLDRCCDGLIVASEMRAVQKIPENLPCISALYPDEESINPDSLSEILVMIPVTDKLASNTRTPADAYAKKCIDIARKNAEHYENELEFWQDNKLQIAEDYKRAVENRTNISVLSIILSSLLIAVVGLVFGAGIAFLYLNEFSLTDSFLSVLSQSTVISAAAIAAVGGIVGGFVGRHFVKKSVD